MAASEDQEACGGLLNKKSLTLQPELVPIQSTFYHQISLF